MAKMQLQNFTTPRGAFIYPHLVEPDTRFKAEGEYNVKLALDDDIAEKFAAPLEAQLEAFMDEQVPLIAERAKGAKGAKLKKAKALGVQAALREINELFEAEVDDEGEDTGRQLFKFKLAATVTVKASGKSWDQKPKLFDSQANEITESLAIWSGTEGKISGEIMPYFIEKDGVFGLSLRCKGAQILKLVSGGGASASDMGFGAEDDGFTSEGADNGFEPEDDNDDGEDEF
jgi:hypothetical protein